MMSERGYKKSQDKDKMGGGSQPLLQMKCLSEVDFVQIFWFESAPIKEEWTRCRKSYGIYFDTFHEQVFVICKTFLCICGWN